jgi:hypothetical protein
VHAVAHLLDVAVAGHRTAARVGREHDVAGARGRRAVTHLRDVAHARARAALGVGSERAVTGRIAARVERRLARFAASDDSVTARRPTIGTAGVRDAAVHAAAVHAAAVHAAAVHAARVDDITVDRGRCVHVAPVHRSPVFHPTATIGGRTAVEHGDVVVATRNEH